MVPPITNHHLNGIQQKRDELSQEIRQKKGTVAFQTKCSLCLGEKHIQQNANAKEDYPDAIEDHVYAIPYATLHLYQGRDALSYALEKWVCSQNSGTSGENTVRRFLARHGITSRPQLLQKPAVASIVPRQRQFRGAKESLVHHCSFLNHWKEDFFHLRICILNLCMEHSYEGARGAVRRRT